MSEYPESLLIGYILQSLSPEETYAIEQRLENEPWLRQELRQWQETLALVAHGEVTPPAPAALKTRILASAQGTAPGTRALAKRSIQRALRPQALVSQQRSPQPSWHRWSMGVAAASLLVGLGFGLDNYRLRHQLVTVQATQAHIPEEAHFLTLVANPAQAASEASAKVVIDETQGRVLLVAQRLVPLPEDETYYLWAIMEDSAIICGQISVEAGETAIADLFVNPALYTSELVSMRLVRGKRGELPRSPQENVVLMTES